MRIRYVREVMLFYLLCFSITECKTETGKNDYNNYTLGFAK